MVFQWETSGQFKRIRFHCLRGLNRNSKEWIVWMKRDEMKNRFHVFLAKNGSEKATLKTTMKVRRYNLHWNKKDTKLGFYNVWIGGCRTNNSFPAGKLKQTRLCSHPRAETLGPASRETRNVVVRDKKKISKKFQKFFKTWVPLEYCRYEYLISLVYVQKEKKVSAWKKSSELSINSLMIFF